jgi:predicted metal-binding membrane protein
MMLRRWTFPAVVSGVAGEDASVQPGLGLPGRLGLGVLFGVGSGAGWAWVSVYAAILISWLAIWLMDPLADLPDGASVFGAEYIRALCLAAVENASLPALWAMWAIMGIAMMLPSAVPALRDYAELSQTAASRGGEARPAVSVLALASGYLTVWFGFAVLAAFAQRGLANAGLLDWTGTSTSLWLSAALLAVAGAYQFSALKDACLSACQSPMLRFIAGWKPGPIPAFRMGLSMGAHCVGCCWALMALAFVGGTMNLAFMGLAALIMTFEKLPAFGRWMTRPLGLVLLMGSAALAGAGLAI